jgi:hypothetical protein
VIGRQYRLRAIGAHVFVAAVVQQDYVTASNLLCDLLFNRSGRRRIPVVTCHIPHHRLKAQFTGDAKDRGAPSAERRAEQIRMLANSALQCVAAFGEFLSNLASALEDQQWMREGVVAHDVSGFDDLPHDFRLLLHVASDQEKSCVYIVLGKNIQQTQRVRIVWPIVVGERDLIGATWQAGERAPLPLSRRRHGLITRGSNRGSDDRPGEHGSQHGRIVIVD